jgi:hypothetical protein
MMINSVSFEKAKRSKVQRLGFLPRFAFTLEIGGRQLSYRSAPTIENLVNLWKRGFSMENFIDIAAQQLSEVQLPKLDLGNLKKPARRKSVKRSSK